MSCGYKDSETGKVCGVKTSINPKTNEHFEYCVRCFRTIRKNRQEKFIEASRKAVGKRECQWIGNYIEKDKTFRIKCIELPIHDGWCSHHKKVHNDDDDEVEVKKSRESLGSKKSVKSQKKVDEELDEFMTNIAKDDKPSKGQKGKAKLLADNPELSEEDNIVVESNKSSGSKKKVRETKPKPEESEVKKTSKSRESKESKKSDKVEKSEEPDDDEIIVVKKSTKKDKKSKVSHDD